MPPQQSKQPDFIPGPPPPDFIPAAAPYTPTDDRNGIQKAFDNVTTVTPEQQQGHGPVVNALQKFGAGAIQGAGQPFVHPVDTIEGLGHAFAHPIDTAHSMGEQFDADPAKAIGNVVGGAGLGMAAEAGLGKVIPPIAKSISERVRGYKSPVIPDEIQNASKVAKSIRPPGGINASLEPDIASELPKIKAYAEQTGNPFHSQWEASHASRGLAEQGLEHFKTKLLDPLANDRISMKGVPEYQGPTGGEGNQTTLGNIHQRIVDINKQLRGPLNTAKTTGAEISAIDRIGLGNEQNKLVDIMNRHISEKTGIPPEDIDALRRGYGKQFGIADTIDAARRTRLGPQGAEAEGSSTFPTSKTGLIEKALTTLRGGQDYLANRNFRKASAPFAATPASYPEPTIQRAMEQSRTPIRGGSTEYPTFGTEDVGPRVRGNIEARNTAKTATAETNKASALQEFLQAHDLEQGAQDASASRASRAQGLRESRVATREAGKKLEGETNKASALQEFLQAHDLEQGAQDASASRASRAQGLRESRVATREAGKKLEGEAARTIGRRNAMNQRSQ